MRRTVLTSLAVLLLVAGLGAAAVAAGGGSTVTRPRLERSLPVVFANLYSERARLLGRTNVTPASVHARAMCDKHGAQGPDEGAGGDWVCLMSWTDPQTPMPPEGYGKFELNVHSNDCYTASGPSKLTGFLTLTDTTGAEVTNPVFEFDGCFDPDGTDTPTGHEFPSLLSVSSTALSTDPEGRVDLQLSCGTGEEGCAGTVVAAVGDDGTGPDLGTLDIAMAEETTTTLTFVTPVPQGTQDVTFTLDTTTGVGPSSPVSLSTAG